MSEKLKLGEKLFYSCKHNLNGQGCGLNGYPVIDCPHCTSYREDVMKRYALVTCKGEEDERIYIAEIAERDIAMVRADIRGEVNRQYYVGTVDDEKIEIGIIDDIYEVTELDTFPNDDRDYCIVFDVPNDWLLDTIKTMDSFNERKDVTLTDFLEAYVWEETEVIYNLAKQQGKLLREAVQQ